MKIIHLTALLILFITYTVICQEQQSYKVLYANEESDFKNELFLRIKKEMTDLKCDVKKIALKGLKNEKISNYDAVIIVNEIWMWRLTKSVNKFLKPLTAADKEKVILINTAGDEDWQEEEHQVHAITSASKNENFPELVKFVKDRFAEISEK